MCAKLRTVAASNNRDHARNLSSRTLVIMFNRSHVNIGRAATSQSLLLLLARATLMMVLFFTHIPFVVNHTINATPPERLQHHHYQDVQRHWQNAATAFSKLVYYKCLTLSLRERIKKQFSIAKNLILSYKYNLVNTFWKRHVRPKLQLRLKPERFYLAQTFDFFFQFFVVISFTFQSAMLVSLSTVRRSNTDTTCL